MKQPTYTWSELKERVRLMNPELFLSNQYGMVFILNTKGEILLNITALLDTKSETISSLQNVPNPEIQYK